MYEQEAIIADPDLELASGTFGEDVTDKCDRALCFRKIVLTLG